MNKSLWKVIPVRLFFVVQAYELPLFWNDSGVETKKDERKVCGRRIATVKLYLLGVTCSQSSACFFGARSFRPLIFTVSGDVIRSHNSLTSVTSQYTIHTDNNHFDESNRPRTRIQPQVIFSRQTFRVSLRIAP